MRVERELTASFAALVIAVGCAAQAPAPQAPPAGKGQDSVSSELERLERELALAEQRLADRFEHELATSTKSDGGEGRAQGGAELDEEAAGNAHDQPERKPSPKDAGPTTAPTPGQATARGDAQSTGRTPCADACRALASMQRSADRICELTGPAAARCTAAKARVERAALRVGNAGCVCPAR